MKKPSPRMSKVNSTLRQVVAEEVERLNDARLEFVSITAVDTSPDLRHADVYIDVLGEGDTPDALKALRGAARRLQSAIGSQVRMKYTPTLTFHVDPGVRKGERIDAILRSLRDDHGEEE